MPMFIVTLGFCSQKGENPSEIAAEMNESVDLRRVVLPLHQAGVAGRAPGWWLSVGIKNWGLH